MNGVQTGARDRVSYYSKMKEAVLYKPYFKEQGKDCTHSMRSLAYLSVSASKGHGPYRTRDSR